MKPNFQKFLTRKYSVLMDDIIVESWLEKKRFFRLTGVKETVDDLEIIDGDFCFDVNWMNHIIKKYARREDKFFWNFCKRGYLYGEKLKKYVRGLNLENNFKALREKYFKSLELLKDLIVFLPQTHPLAKIIENNIREVLKQKKIEENKFEETLIALTHPDKINTPVLEQIELRKIKAKLNDPKFNLQRALSEHVKKFAFLGYREPFVKGFNLDFFKKRLKERDQFVKNTETIKIKFNTKEKKKIELMKELVYFRNYRTEKMLEAFYYLEPLWNKIGLLYGLKENELAHYTIKEVEALFKRGIKVKRNIIRAREKGHGFLVHNRNKRLITGTELNKKITEYNSVEKGIKEIKGSAACRGRIKGIARVVLGAKDQNKVKVGEVLVTSMTTPDYLPSMRRASAFVTDEGGITCHAAIVAREMRKPCIIGTKIATKVLHDGDLVEVDANKGIVKIK